MRPRSVLGSCLAALAVLYLLELLYHGALSACYPYDLNYGEGYVLNDALRLWRGEQIWTDITQFPMVRSAYPPLYLLVTGLLSSASPSFLGARALSLLSALAIGAMLFWQGRRIGGWTAAVLAVGLWFGSTFVYQWAPLARVDMLGLAFSLAAVLVVATSHFSPEPSASTGEGADASPSGRGRATAPLAPSPGEGVQRISNRRLALAALLCSLALLTKQTFLAAPLAILLFLALNRDLRALWFAGAVGGIVGGVTLALSATSNGQYVQHVVLGNSANPYRLDRTAEMLGLFLRINPIAALAAVWAIVLVWSRTRRTLLGVYLPLALGTLLTAGNVSGDVNYFLEPTVALALAAPFAWNGAAAWSALRGALPPTIALAQLILLVHLPNGFMAHYPPGPAKGSTPVPEDVLMGDHVDELVRSAGPDVLVELAGFAVLARRPVWLQPIDLQAEQRRGRWSPDLLNSTIADHRWSLVVLSYKFLPAESLAALEREYEQIEGLASPNGFSYFIYRPRDRPSS